MSRPYHTLLVRDGSPGCPWSIEFGDYSMRVVKDEREDYRDQGFKASELKIITTAEDQGAIEHEVREINKADGYWSEHSPEACH